MNLGNFFNVPVHIVRFLDQFTRFTLFDGVEEIETTPDCVRRVTH